MRGLQSTLALLVVLVGLGAYIYFVPWKQPAGGGTSDRRRCSPALDADKIDEIKIKSEAGDATTLKKEGGAWQIVSPVAAKAAESELSAITTALGPARNRPRRRRESRQPGRLRPGDAPRVEVEFKAPAASRLVTLLIGDKTPTGASLYAKRDDEKRVFLVAAFQESPLNQSTFDLRDKTLIAFARDKVVGVDVTSGGKAIKLAKKDNDWRSRADQRPRRLQRRPKASSGGSRPRR